MANKAIEDDEAVQIYLAAETLGMPEAEANRIKRP